MKFYVTRTSMFSDDEFPACDLLTPEKMLNYLGEEQVFHSVNIKSLPQFIKFIEDNGGRVVIEKSYKCNNQWTIEIYDTYRD